MRRLIHRMHGPIARGTVRTSFVLGLRLVVQGGTLLLVARMLGPQQFGAFAGVAALAVILGTLSTFGTHLVLLGEVSKDPARRAEVLPWAIPTTLLCGGALLGIYLLVCIFALGENGLSMVVVLAIGIAETLLQPLLALMVAEHHGLGRIARSQLLQIMPLTLRLASAAAVYVLALANPLAGYVWGYIIASLVALAVAVLAIPAPWPALHAWRLPRPTELRETAGYATLNITAAGPAELDKTIAANVLPLAWAGLYAAGARVVGAATMPVSAMMLAALPRLFREAHGRSPQAARLTGWVFAAAFGFSVVLAALLWWIAPAFVLVFGPRYAGIQQTIHWLAWAVPGMALRKVAGAVLVAAAKPWVRVGFETVGIIVLFVAAIPLATRFGTVGMAAALICSEWSMAVVGVTAAASLMGASISPRRT